MKYTATFSNGQTVTRTSEKNYTHCGAFVNGNQVKGASFSATIPQPYYSAIGATMPSNQAMIGYKQRQALTQKAEAIRAEWKWEVVKVLHLHQPRAAAILPT